MFYVIKLVEYGKHAVHFEIYFKIWCMEMTNDKWSARFVLQIGLNESHILLLCIVGRTVDVLVFW